jgi:hypothetical protein
MYLISERIDYMDQYGNEKVEETNRLIPDDTFNIYMDMIVDFQEPHFQLQVLNYEYYPKSEISKAISKYENVQVHSNYLTIHMDIDKLYNNKVRSMEGLDF